MVAQLNLVLINDVQGNLLVLNSLLEKILNENNNVDGVLVTGDLCKVKETTRPEDMAAREGEASSLLFILESISSQVFYLPGLNDPNSMKSVLQEVGDHAILSPNSVNCQDRSFVMSPGLRIAAPLTEELRYVPPLLASNEAASSEYSIIMSSSADIYNSQLLQSQEFWSAEELASLELDSMMMSPEPSLSATLSTVSLSSPFQRPICIVRICSEKTWGVRKLGDGSTSVHPGSLSQEKRWASIVLNRSGNMDAWSLGSVHFRHL